MVRSPALSRSTSAVYALASGTIDCCGVDGAAVKLKGGHEVRLNKAEADAFQHRFEQEAVIEDLGVVLRDRPALSPCEFAADPELVSDRGFPLIVGGVAGVDGDFHSQTSSREDFE